DECDGRRLLSDALRLEARACEGALLLFGPGCLFDEQDATSRLSLHESNLAIMARFASVRPRKTNIPTIRPPRQENQHPTHWQPRCPEPSSSQAFGFLLPSRGNTSFNGSDPAKARARSCCASGSNTSATRDCSRNSSFTPSVTVHPEASLRSVDT